MSVYTEYMLRKGGIIMNRKTFAIILVATIMLGVFAGCGKAANEKASSSEMSTPAASSSNEVYEITFAHFFPVVHPVHVRHEAWAKALSEASNGRIKIVFRYGETLLKAAETYEGVTSGIADMGLVVPSYTPGLFPMSELYELPVNYSNCQVISKVLWQVYQEFQPKEWSGVKVLGIYAIGPGGIATKKPVRNLNNLKGMQIRAVGTSADYMKALGAAPVSITMPESYEAISRGVCDGVLNAWDAFITWKLVEVADYYTMTPFLYVAPFVQVMNLDKWNSLPPDIQEIFTRVTEEYIDYHSEEEAKNALTSVQAILDAGHEIIPLSEEEEKAWQAAVATAVDSAIAARADKGPAQEFYDRIVELAEQYNPDYPSLKDKMVEMMAK